MWKPEHRRAAERRHVPRDPPCHPMLRQIVDGVSPEAAQAIALQFIAQVRDVVGRAPSGSAVFGL